MEAKYTEEINKKDIKVYDKHVVFWGSPFSNFFPSEFKLGGKKWETSEKYFMAKKAEFFKDTETYEKILATTHPKDAKKLGREVKNFDSNKWSEVSFSVMRTAVFAKFTQNIDLMNFILDKEFEGKGFVEGSPFDGIWGVKMDWRNPDVDDETKWNGLNLLGKVLDEVREEIKKASKV